MFSKCWLLLLCLLELLLSLRKTQENYQTLLEKIRKTTGTQFQNVQEISAISWIVYNAMSEKTVEREYPTQEILP